MAAVRNRKHGKDIMTLLLDQIRSDMIISEQVLIAAANNSKHGIDILRLFLDRARGDDFIVTEKMIESAAESLFHGADIMAFYLDRGSRISEITESITIAILENWVCGVDIMRLLHRRGQDVKCTDGVILAWHANYYPTRDPGLEKWIQSRGERETSLRIYREYHLL